MHILRLPIFDNITREFKMRYFELFKDIRLIYIEIISHKLLIVVFLINY